MIKTIKTVVQKASLTFARGSLVGVGCKLAQFVVYRSKCMTIRDSSKNKEKKGQKEK